MSKKVKFNLPQSYEVGYAKPPEKSRFKPGISGNAKGRSKGAKNKAPVPPLERLTETILHEAYRGIPILEGGKTRKITMMEANIRAMANHGAKGNTRAAGQFIKMVQTIEDKKATDRLDDMRKAFDYKESCYEEIAHQKRLGLKAPEFLPHPDHVQIDWETGEVWLTGPATKEQAQMHKKLQHMEGKCNEGIQELEKMLADRHNKKIRKLIEIEIAFERKKNEAIKTALHDVIYNYRGG